MPNKFPKIKTADSPEAQDRSADPDKAFLALARERFMLAEEAEADNRKISQDDLEFSIGDQWPKDIRSARTAESKPCLQSDHIGQSLKQVSNEQRQQETAIQINPVGDGADVETAEIYQGIIRHIETNSDAEVVYDFSFDGMLRTGFHYWRLLTEYPMANLDLDELDQPLPAELFQQEIKIKRIKNQFTVYFDPTCSEPDYSDARWAFIIEQMSKEEYKSQYGDSDAAKMDDFSSIGDQAPGWAEGKTIRVAEYFYVEEKPIAIALMRDGSVQRMADLAEADKGSILRRRELLDRKVMWSKINGIEKLDEKVWPGLWIPIIPVLGDDLDINGKRYLAGLIRNAKDPQRMYNYWISCATQTIALAPNAPFVIDSMQMEGFEGEWESANRSTKSALPYKHVDNVPPPQRNVYEPPVQAVNLMIHLADNDIKAAMGLYDASLGKAGPEQSGKAILERKTQGNLATLNYADNLSRAKRACGRQLVDLIPKVYDVPRIQRIIKPDGSVQHVGIFNSRNAQQAEAEHAIQDQLEAFSNPAIKKVYDLGVGRYDVNVSTGPSYQSKRQEAQVSLMAFMQAVPTAAPFIADLVAAESDWPGAKELAKRLKKTLPPALQDMDEQSAEAMVTELQSQLAQLGPQHEQMVAEVQKLTQIVNEKQVEAQSRKDIAQMQEESRQQIEQFKAGMQREIELAKLANARDIAEIQSKAQDQLERHKLDAAMDREQHIAAADAALAAQDHAHTLIQSDQAHQQAIEQGDQQQQNALEQGDQSHQQTLEQGQQSADNASAQAAQQSALAAEQPQPGAQGDSE